MSPDPKADLIRGLSRTHDALIVVSQEHPFVTDALHAVTPDTPVVTLASDLPNSGRLTYVGPDNRLAGRVAADLMRRLLGDRRGEVLVISGLHSLVCHGEREMGFRSALQERHPDCRIVGVVESRERRDMTGELVRDVLERHPSLGGIYNVSSGNRALADALKRLGRDQDTVLVTHELTAERRALLREGVIDAIIDQTRKWKPSWLSRRSRITSVAWESHPLRRALRSRSILGRTAEDCRQDRRWGYRYSDCITR